MLRLRYAHNKLEAQDKQYTIMLSHVSIIIGPHIFSDSKTEAYDSKKLSSTTKFKQASSFCAGLLEDIFSYVPFINLSVNEIIIRYEDDYYSEIPSSFSISADNLYLSFTNSQWIFNSLEQDTFHTMTVIDKSTIIKECTVKNIRAVFREYPGIKQFNCTDEYIQISLNDDWKETKAYANCVLVDLNIYSNILYNISQSDQRPLIKLDIICTNPILRITPNLLAFMHNTIKLFKLSEIALNQYKPIFRPAHKRETIKAWFLYARKIIHILSTHTFSNPFQNYLNRGGTISNTIRIKELTVELINAALLYSAKLDSICIDYIISDKVFTVTLLCKALYLFSNIKKSLPTSHISNIIEEERLKILMQNSIMACKLEQKTSNYEPTMENQISECIADSKSPSPSHRITQEQARILKNSENDTNSLIEIKLDSPQEKAIKVCIKFLKSGGVNELKGLSVGIGRINIKISNQIFTKAVKSFCEFLENAKMMLPLYKIATFLKSLTMKCVGRDMLNRVCNLIDNTVVDINIGTTSAHIYDDKLEIGCVEIPTLSVNVTRTSIDLLGISITPKPAGIKYLFNHLERIFSLFGNANIYNKIVEYVTRYTIIRLARISNQIKKVIKPRKVKEESKQNSKIKGILKKDIDAINDEGLEVEEGGIANPLYFSDKKPGLSSSDSLHPIIKLTMPAHSQKPSTSKHDIRNRVTARDDSTNKLSLSMRPSNTSVTMSRNNILHKTANNKLHNSIDMALKSRYKKNDIFRSADINKKK